MWDLPRLILGLSGVVVFAIGLFKQQRVEIAAGIAFAGTALFGHLAKADPAYDPLHEAFAVGMLGVGIAKLVLLKRRPVATP